jgi:hypothetical protein
MKLGQQASGNARVGSLNTINGSYVWVYRQRENEEMENLNSSLLGLLAGDQRSDDDSSEGDKEPAEKKRRKSKRPAMYTADDGGTRRRLDARMTMWFLDPLFIWSFLVLEPPFFWVLEPPFKAGGAIVVVVEK